jgi:DNA-binding NarL/FixJ family response regulator
VSPGAHNDRSPDRPILANGDPHPHRTAGDLGSTRVLIAEALDVVRVGLRAVLEREADITVVGDGSPEHVIALATELRPDVILMDARLPGVDPLAAVCRLVAHPGSPQPKVVLVAADERRGNLLSAVRSRISGFLFLEAERAEVIRAVRVVAGGGAYLSPRATRELFDEIAAGPDFAHPDPEQHPDCEQFDELTARERQLVLLAALGLSNCEIAERLVISPATVKTHICHAMNKLQTHDRAKLVALAYQTGLMLTDERHNGW